MHNQLALSAASVGERVWHTARARARAQDARLIEEAQVGEGHGAEGRHLRRIDGKAAHRHRQRAQPRQRAQRRHALAEDVVSVHRQVHLRWGRP